MVEREYARETPFSPGGILGHVPDLIHGGKIPAEYLPQTAENLAALNALQEAWRPDQEELAALARRLYQSVPPRDFWCFVAASGRFALILAAHAVANCCSGCLAAALQLHSIKKAFAVYRCFSRCLDTLQTNTCVL
jgi:hypothetical protein